MPAAAPDQVTSGAVAGSAPARVCFVCSGNICRSPTAEVVTRELARRRGLEHAVLVTSAGTGDWHVGEPADARAVACLRAHGYDGCLHRARQFDPAQFAALDRVVALDRSHLRTLQAWAPTPADRVKVHLLRSFDPAIAGDVPDLGPPAAGAWLDVPDPYYEGPDAFDAVLDLVESACGGLLDDLASATPSAVRGS